MVPIQDDCDLVNGTTMGVVPPGQVIVTVALATSPAFKAITVISTSPEDSPCLAEPQAPKAKNTRPRKSATNPW
jgi:hypothetical protein